MTSAAEMQELIAYESNFQNEAKSVCVTVRDRCSKGDKSKSWRDDRRKREKMVEAREEQRRHETAGVARLGGAGTAGDVVRAVGRLTYVDPAAALLCSTVRGSAPFSSYRGVGFRSGGRLRLGSVRPEGGVGDLHKSCTG